MENRFYLFDYGSEIGSDLGVDYRILSGPFVQSDAKKQIQRPVLAVAGHHLI